MTILPFTKPIPSTRAQRIASTFLPTHTCRLACGWTLTQVCQDYAISVACKVGITRYVFADKSVIVDLDQFWDLGFGECFCCRSRGHRYYCEAGKGPAPL